MKRNNKMVREIKEDVKQYEINEYFILLLYIISIYILLCILYIPYIGFSKKKQIIGKLWKGLRKFMRKLKKNVCINYSIKIYIK